MDSKRSACPARPPTGDEGAAPRAEAARAAAEAARMEAEATNAQLRAMQALTDTALSHLALDDLLRELLDRLVVVMDVDNASILLLDEDGRTLIPRAARGLLEETIDRVRVPVGHEFAGRIAASRQPMIVDDLSTFEGGPILREHLHAIVGVPLLVEDQEEGRVVSRLVGVVHVGSAAPRRFTAADVELLQRAADRIALAIERARLYASEQAARQRAEAALARAQASEAQAAERAERLNTILETMADGVVVTDRDGRHVQLVNRAYRELLGVERMPGYAALPIFDRARLLNLRDIVTGAPLPFEDSSVARALRGEVVTGPGAEVRMRAFDGRELEVNSSAAPLRDGDGRVVGAVTVVRDVTERNRLAREREVARVQAERQAEQLDRIFEAAADGLIVYDAEGRMARANVAARRILSLDAAPPGYSQLPMLERLAYYAARDEQDRPIPPEELPFMRVLSGEVGAGTETETGAETCDVRLRALDGREVEVTFTVAPLRDREGHLVGAVSLFRDQTERRRLERERAAALARAQASEAQAAERAQRLNTILETIADGVAVYDTEGRPLQVTNRAYRELYALERAPAGFEALSVQDRVGLLDVRDDATGAPLPFEDTPAARALRGEVVTGPDADIRVRAFDGRELEVNNSTAPLREPDGRVAGIVLVLHDMTERNRLAREREEARIRAERQADLLDRIFEAAADGLVVWDAERQQVRVNAAARRILGMDAAPPGFDQLPVRERLARYSARDEQDRPMAPEEWPVMRVLRGEVGAETGTGAEARDLWMRALDGREIEVTVSTSPLWDREGHFVGAVTVVHDQTERKRLERERAAALAQAQASEAQAAERAQRLRTILETMADGVAVYDAEGRPLQVTNRAYRKLYAVEHAPGYETLPTFERARLLDLRDALTGAPLPFEDTPIARALRGEVVTGPRAELRVRALDGRELEVNSSTAPLREPDGRIVGAVLVVRDMTERNRLERERAAARADELAAREASRRMEAFLATAAHDLRSPLTATAGYIALAQRYAERLVAATREEYPAFARQVEAVRGRLEDADQGAARLTRLLTLLFDTAALRADRLELHRAPGDLTALVREQVAALRVAAPGRSIRLHVPASGRPIPVEVDADRIGEVVTNYVTNALKYSPPDRPVEVAVAARGGRAHVVVCDQGPGLPKQERARVWELFHRAPGVTAQDGMQGGSLGLGLYICKAIITAHGGRVGVRSAVGEGSTFWFTLPLSGPMPDVARATC